MVVGEDVERLVRKHHLVHLAILLIIILGIGVYLIATTVLIAKDGVAYIEYAKQLAVEPAKAMRGTYLHPGYSFLIYIVNKLVGQFYGGTSLGSWIISAQSVSLLCKTIATVVLYLIGSLLVGPRMSFWAVLILTILPDSAEYGSDALTDWPHIMFLVTGFWLLLLSVKSSKWQAFGFVGIIAGLGYLVRPECCQLVIYGGGWLLLRLVRPQREMSRTRTVGCLISLLAGFAITAGPYMKFMGYVFPEHRIGSFARFVDMADSNIDKIGMTSEYFAGFVPIELAKGIWKFSSNIHESLIYYFVPALLIGIYYHFQKQARREEKFFVPAFILFNVVVLLWLYCKGGYISRRHTLPLVALTIFYVPIGLQLISEWFARLFFRTDAETYWEKSKSQLCFLALIVIGMAICVHKLLEPMRTEKKGYRTAAKWLKENTTEKALIAVPDRRIGFYAERPMIVFDDRIPKGAKYIVKIVKDQDKSSTPYQSLHEEQSIYINERDKKDVLIIYKVM